MAVKIKYKRFIASAFILAPMTLIMGLVGVLKNYGLKEGWVLKWMKTWITMFPIAFLAGLLVIPFANKLLQKINFSDGK